MKTLLDLIDLHPEKLEIALWVLKKLEGIFNIEYKEDFLLNIEIKVKEALQGGDNFLLYYRNPVKLLTLLLKVLISF